MNHLVFAYGTLLFPDVQRVVMGRLIDGRPDRLFAYRKCSLHDGQETFPNVAPDPDGVVDGRLLEVTDEELARMDGYEGDLYSRRRVTLASGVDAWVYVGL